MNGKKKNKKDMNNRKRRIKRRQRKREKNERKKTQGIPHTYINKVDISVLILKFTLTTLIIIDIIDHYVFFF